MIGTREHKTVADEIFKKHGGLYGFPENIRQVRVLFQSEVQRYIVEAHNDIGNAETDIFTGETYQFLSDFKIFILSLDGYGFTGDFRKIQKHKEGFYNISLEELMSKFLQSKREDWDSDREYYFALFQVIEDTLEEKGINLGFWKLFE